MKYILQNPLICCLNNLTLGLPSAEPRRYSCRQFVIKYLELNADVHSALPAPLRLQQLFEIIFSESLPPQQSRSLWQPIQTPLSQTFTDESDFYNNV